MLRVALTGEARQGRVVEKQMLRTVGVAFPNFNQPRQLRDRGNAVVGDAVVIPIKDAGRAHIPQEDQGIGNGLEPGRDERAERLTGLGIVVVHEGDRMRLIRLGQRAGKEPGHIVIAV